SMAAGALTQLGDPLSGVATFSTTFRFDSVLLQVASTNPPAGGVFTVTGPITYDVNFNEAVDRATVRASDLSLSAIPGASVTGVTVLPGNGTARFTISGIGGEGTLSTSIAAGAMTDAFGNVGAAFGASYAVDFDTAPFPAALTANLPLGSLVYSGSV